jgi:membrane-associated protein
MDFLKDAFHFLTDVEGMIRAGGYVALAIIVFTETGLMIGFFLPGDSLLVTAGLFAARGDLNIVYLNLLLMTMAVLGDATGYYIGHKLGPALFRRESSRLFKKQHLIRTQLFYEKHGGKTIVIARFIPIIRTFAPVVAGIAGMKYRRFATFNIFGGLGWVLSMTMIGYLLGRLIPNIDKYIEIVIIVVIFLSLVPGFVEHWRARRAIRRAEEEYRKIVERLVARLKGVEWVWSREALDGIVAGLDLEGAKVHAGGNRVEFMTQRTDDSQTMSEAAYQHAQWEYEKRFKQAVEAAVAMIGPADFPVHSDALDVAVWNLSHGRLLIEHRHEGRGHPFRIALVVQEQAQADSRMV